MGEPSASRSFALRSLTYAYAFSSGVRSLASSSFRYAPTVRAIQVPSPWILPLLPHLLSLSLSLVIHALSPSTCSLDIFSRSLLLLCRTRWLKLRRPVQSAEIPRERQKSTASDVGAGAGGSISRCSLRHSAGLYLLYHTSCLLCRWGRCGKETGRRKNGRRPEKNEPATLNGTVVARAGRGGEERAREMQAQRKRCKGGQGADSEAKRGRCDGEVQDKGYGLVTNALWTDPV